MHAELLGPFRVVGDDGADVTPRSDQQRSVLAVLVANAPGGVSISALET